MIKTRVIPCLLLKESGLVKGVGFKNHTYVGDPINAVRIFNDKEVDEMIFLDIDATRIKQGPNFELIKDIASEAFMPFAYGGGVTKIEHIEKLFKLGVEKVVLNTVCGSDLSFLSEASRIAGSQSIVGSIDVKKSLFGKYKVFTNSGRTELKESPIELALSLQNAGVGEIMVTSIDLEGTRKGMDLQLIEAISKAVSVPVVASGGVGDLDHFKQAALAGASAVAAGSYFTFHGKHKAVLITYPDYDELERLLNTESSNGR